MKLIGIMDNVPARMCARSLRNLYFYTKIRYTQAGTAMLWQQEQEREE